MKREAVLVSREELRAHNREERKRKAEEKKARLLEEADAARQAAADDDAWLDAIPAAPLFTPTAEEWADPLAYIGRIQREAAEWGVCIVRAPVAPSTPGGLAMLAQDPEGRFRFSTRLQAVRDAPWTDWEGQTFLPGKRYTLREFQEAAAVAAAKRLGGLVGCLPARTIEREYWRERGRGGQGGAHAQPPLYVEYGSDVDGTLFVPQDALGATRWNLNVLPCEPGSALRLCAGAHIPGVSAPMLYCGQLFSTFAWHVEDHFLYSINYQHLGASKTWYGVPASQADAFEAVARRTVYAPAVAALEASGASEEEVWRHVERALIGKTTMFSPRALLEAGVRVCRAVQQPGDYVITFPRAYHAGFGNGFQVGEAANFGMDSWWPFGEDARRRYRGLRHPAIVPHEQLLADEARALAAGLQRQPQQEQQQEGEQAAEEEAVKQEAGQEAAAPGEHQPDQQQQQQPKQEQQEGQQQQRAAEASSPAALAHTFVGRMRRLNHCRAVLEAASAAPLAACPADGPAARQSLHCTECQQSVYAASAVLAPAGPPSAWRHVCLECAAAAAAAAQGASAQAPAGSRVLLFVKPCWGELEACARQLERGLPDLADAPLTLPVAGTTEADRYGPSVEPSWPSPSQPYAWRPLQPPRAEWPAELLHLLAAPAATTAAKPAARQAAAAPRASAAGVPEPAGEAAAAAAAADPAGMLTPEQAFFAAWEQQQQQQQAAQQQQQEGLQEEEGSRVAPAQPAGPRSGMSGRQPSSRKAAAPKAASSASPASTANRQQQQPEAPAAAEAAAAAEEGEGAELLLRLVGTSTVVLDRLQVERAVYEDAAGARVLLGADVMLALLGGKPDRRNSAPRVLGPLLAQQGQQVVKARFPVRTPRHNANQAKAAVWQQHAAALLASSKVAAKQRERLQLYFSGVWPELDAAGGANGAASEPALEPQEQLQEPQQERQQEEEQQEQQERQQQQQEQQEQQERQQQQQEQQEQPEGEAKPSARPQQTAGQRRQARRRARPKSLTEPPSEDEDEEDDEDEEEMVAVAAAPASTDASAPSSSRPSSKRLRRSAPSTAQPALPQQRAAEQPQQQQPQPQPPQQQPQQQERQQQEYQQRYKQQQEQQRQLQQQYAMQLQQQQQHAAQASLPPALHPQLQAFTPAGQRQQWLAQRLPQLDSLRMHDPAAYQQQLLLLQHQHKQLERQQWQQQQLQLAQAQLQQQRQQQAQALAQQHAAQQGGPPADLLSGFVPIAGGQQAPQPQGRLPLQQVFQAQLYYHDQTAAGLYAAPATSLFSASGSGGLGAPPPLPQR